MMDGECFSLYVPGVSAGGGHGNGFLCTNLDSLLVEDMEMLFVSTYLDSLLLEDREMILSVHSCTLV